MLDYHMHSDISADSEADMIKMAESAYKKGLKEICFTEHIDLEFPSEISYAIDFERYKRKYAQVKDMFPGMRINKGIEAGFGLDTNERTARIVTEHDLDFVIGSQHLVYGLDPFENEIWERYSQKEIYTEYIRLTIENVKDCDFFNVLGHIGYPAKCCPHDEKALKYVDYHDGIETLLKIIIEKGKGIEVNTSAFLSSGYTMPEASIIKRYFELGGEIITVGSDSHKTEFVGRYVNETLEMLKNIGFKYVCAFDKLKPRFLKI